jgi:hypothetical protein
MRSKITVLLLLVCLSLVAGRDVIEQKLDRLSWTIEKPFDLVVTDKVATSFIQNGADLESARIAILDEYICSPVFGETYRQGGKCSNFVSRAGFGEKTPASLKLRAFVIEIEGRAKKYLADPMNLRALYQSRKVAMVAAFKILDPEKQQAIISRLEKAQYAFSNLDKKSINADADADSLSFAYSRFSEGGPELIAAYDQVTANFLRAVKPPPQQ